MSLGIFDSRFAWTWIEGRDEDGVRARLHVTEDDPVTVGFRSTLDARLLAVHVGRVEDQHTAREVSFWASDGEVHTLTYAGRAGTVIATVGDILQAYLRQHEPSMLLFTATKQRARIYEHLVKQTRVPGYVVVKGQSEDYGRDYFIVRGTWGQIPRAAREHLTRVR